MADDWDLNAVVRSCKSVTVTATTADKTASFVDDETLSFLASITLFQHNNDHFSFPNYNNNNAFEELQQFFSEPTFPDNPTTTTNNTIIPNSLMIPDFGASSGQQHQMQHQNGVVLPSVVQQPEAQKHKNNITPVLLPRPVPPGYDVSSNPSLLQLSTMPRPRKRRSQQKKMVCTVTKDNLYSDLWSWRKYGQKPIKGSPYPRNYYRCSSMKGCSARKQVERSVKSPELFVLTYTGEHAHPRPNHRNSLAGTTRAKALPPPQSATTSLLVSAALAADYGGVNIESEKELSVEEDVLIPNVVISDGFFSDVLI